jgi:uncharacterized protein (DUF1778 family)
MTTAKYESASQVTSSQVTSERASKDARLNVRVSESQAALIRRGAEAQGKSLTDFVISSSTLAAEQVLADRRRFALNDASWNVFEALLEQPAVFQPRLAELLAREDTFVD